MPGNPLTNRKKGGSITRTPPAAERQVSTVRNRPQVAHEQPPAEPSFEDKLKQFMTQSDSKQSELNRYMAGKRGSGRRRR